jgi:hypothetical protein
MMGQPRFKQHASSFQESEDNNDSVDPQDSSADTETDQKERVEEESSPVTIAKEETKNVVRLKLATLLVLVSAAIGIAAFTYSYLTHSELAAFRHQFADDSEKVFEAIGRSLDQALASFDNLAVSLVSSAHTTQQTWPFVTIADFPVRLSKVLPLSHAILISVFHVVTPKQRLRYEAYTASHDNWVNESMAVQEDWGGYHGTIEYNGEQNPIIHGDFDNVPYNERYVVGYRRI